MIIENGPYTAYVLINTVNGKAYVGVTRKKNLYNRFNYGWGYVKNKEMFADIQKYGWDKFEQNVFARNLTAEEAYNIEQLLIKKLREQNPDLVYNRDAGGEHGKHCEDTKRIIKQANVNKVVSEETKAKIRKARAKQVITREAIMKTAAKNRGRKMSPEFCKALSERSRKRVLCVDTGRIYESATEAAKDLNVSLSGISQACHGVYESVKGYHFKYV